MEKSPEYSIPPQENKIKKEPEPLIKRVKNIVNNISRRLQKPEVSTQSDEKDSNPLPKEIIELAEKKAGKEEVKDFEDFINKKLKNIDRRTFMKIAVGTAGTAAGVISVDYVVKNFDKLWTEFQKETTLESIEIEYSEGLTKLYEEVHKMPEKKKEYTDLQVGKNLAERLFEYPKKIKNSEKQNLDEFLKGLSQEEFDDLVIGCSHGSTLTDEKSAYITRELIKNNKKIPVIGLEYLSYVDEKDKEAIEKFNLGEISPKQMTRYAGSWNEPLLELAEEKKHSIEITGLEKGKVESVLTRPDWYGRYKEISERVGEITKEITKNKKDGIVGIYIGQGHTTIDGWRYFDAAERLIKKGESSMPSEETALKNNDTIEEYLEKIGFESKVIQIDDWEKLRYEHDNYLAIWYEYLPEDDKRSFYKFCEIGWQNYGLGVDAEGVYPYPNGKENTFLDIINIPPKFPEKPPVLNGYKYAYDNPYLAEILQKLEGIGNVEISQNLVLKVKGLPIVEVDKNTGDVIKMYFPEQARKK